MLSTAVCYFMACSTSQALTGDGHGEGFSPWSGSEPGPPPSSPAPWAEAPQLSCLTEPLPTQPGSQAAKSNAESVLDRSLERPMNGSLSKHLCASVSLPVTPGAGTTLHRVNCWLQREWESRGRSLELQASFEGRGCPGQEGGMAANREGARWERCAAGRAGTWGWPGAICTAGGCKCCS